MKHALRLALAVLLPAAVTFACGSDEKSGNKNEDGGPSGSGGKSGGTGGATAAAGGSSGATAAGGAATVNCDTKPCESAAAALPGGFLTTCCVSATECGVGVATFCAPVPDGGSLFPTLDAGPPEKIVRDPVCKDRAFGAGQFSITLQGCCDPTGVCGYTSQFMPNQCSVVSGAAAGGGFDAGSVVPCHFPGAGAEDGGLDSSISTPDASKRQPDAGGDAG